jgi:small subunit ribosomal protein S6
VKIESWGRRKLAYPVAKMKKGVYFYVKYVGRGGLVAELERTLKLADSVMKFQTVVLRELVDMSALAIDPEEAKVQKVELAIEEEEKESREKALGLVDLGPDAPRSRASEEEYGEDEFDADAPNSKATTEAV